MQRHRLDADQFDRVEQALRFGPRVVLGAYAIRPAEMVKLQAEPAVDDPRDLLLDPLAARLRELARPAFGQFKDRTVVPVEHEIARSPIGVDPLFDPVSAGQRAIGVRCRAQRRCHRKPISRNAASETRPSAIEAPSPTCGSAYRGRIGSPTP